MFFLLINILCKAKLNFVHCNKPSENEFIVLKNLMIG